MPMSDTGEIHEDKRMKIVQLVTSTRELDPDEKNFIVDLLAFLNVDRFEERDLKAFAVLFLDYMTCLNAMGTLARAVGMTISNTHVLFADPYNTICEMNEGETMMDLLLNIKGLLPFGN